jgi:uncharacterized protein with PIN domain
MCFGNHIYTNKNILLVTQHRKEKVIGPLFENEFGAKITVTQTIDTDQFGTFTKIKKRKKSQRITAKNKAKLGIRKYNYDIALASEGSFFKHPLTGIAWNLELVCLIDRKRKIEIYGIYESADTNADSAYIFDKYDLEQFVKKTGFPSHHIIMRPDHAKCKKNVQYINREELLLPSFEYCLNHSRKKRVFIETDMRAHANPTRMINIQKATEKLLEKVLSQCPKCNTIGYSIVRKNKGLPCEQCGQPSELIIKYTYQCHSCGHIEEKLYPEGRFAPMMYCYQCNP